MGLDQASAVVYVVDDDMWVRRALERLLRAAGYQVESYESATVFLAAHQATRSGCLILDIAMPDVGGMDVQRMLNESQHPRAIIFLTGCSSIALSVEAMKSGAVTFLTKPVRGQELVATVREAIRIDHSRKLQEANHNEIRQRLASLTPREREVLGHILDGRLNKQIAAALGTSEQTVKIQRARVMRKMAARSLAELIWVFARLQPAAGSRTPLLPVAGARFQTPLS